MSTDTITRVDPKTLLVGPNVRQNVDLKQPLLDSLRELGVRTPIVAAETPDGLVVIDGQRRTLGAVDVDLATVPVYVTAAGTEADRIIDQVVVNEHRQDISNADAIAAVQQLALFDMTVPAITTKLGISEELVGRAVTVGKSKAATKAFAGGELSLETAAIIAEFDDDPKLQGWGYELTEVEQRVVAGK